MKIKMRAAAIAAAAAVTAGFGTLSAFAETADVYNIWVGGVQVTGENLEDVLDDGGSVSYDPEEGVLYLNDPKIEGDHKGAKIYAEGAPLTVYGQVYLTAEESGKTVIWSEQDLIFENALFTADGFYDGYVSENGSLSFNNSEACFEANGTYPAHGGLLSGGDISVKNSVIYVYGYEAPISCPSGYLSIEGPDTDVTVEDPKGDPMIYGGISFDGGVVPSFSDNIAVSPEGITVTGEGDETYLTIAPAGGLSYINGEIIGSGNVKMERLWYTAGSRAQLHIFPEEGWELASIKITDSEGNAVELDEENYFTVPAGDVNITAEFTELHKHAPVLAEEVPASCEAPGKKAHYACECGKLFEDAEGKTEITDEASLVIPAAGHQWNEGVVTKEPTETEEGEKLYTCKLDPTHTYTEKIPALKPAESSSEAESKADSKNDSKAGNSGGSNPDTGFAAGFAVLTLAGAALLVSKRHK